MSTSVISRWDMSETCRHSSQTGETAHGPFGQASCIEESRCCVYLARYFRGVQPFNQPLQQPWTTSTVPRCPPPSDSWSQLCRMWRHVIIGFLFFRFRAPDLSNSYFPGSLGLFSISRFECSGSNFWKPDLDFCDSSSSTLYFPGSEHNNTPS